MHKTIESFHKTNAKTKYVQSIRNKENKIKVRGDINT